MQTESFKSNYAESRSLAPFMPHVMHWVSKVRSVWGKRRIWGMRQVERNSSGPEPQVKRRQEMTPGTVQVLGTSQSSAYLQVCQEYLRCPTHEQSGPGRLTQWDPGRGGSVHTSHSGCGRWGWRHRSDSASSKCGWFGHLRPTGSMDTPDNWRETKSRCFRHCGLSSRTRLQNN